MTDRARPDAPSTGGEAAAVGVQAAPLDHALAVALQQAAAGWAPARRDAALRLLGWTGNPCRVWSLVEAARTFGGSRETVRRARERLAAAVRDYPGVAEAALRLRQTMAQKAFLGSPARTAGQVVPVAGLADQLMRAGVLNDPERLGAVVRVLDGAGLPCHLQVVAGPDGQARVGWVAGADLYDSGDLADRLFALTADGRPLRVMDLLGQVRSLAGDDEAAQAAAGLLSEGRWRRIDPAGPAAAGDVLPAWVAAAAERADALPVPRALRRILAVTGPLPWPDLLTAWDRGAGQSTFGPLPADVPVLTAWLAPLQGLQVRQARLAEAGSPAVPVVETADPEQVQLDRTTQVLRQVLAARPEGLARHDVLTAAEDLGLKATTASAALTYHPIVVHVGRDLWALLRSPVASDALDASAGEDTGATRPVSEAAASQEPDTVALGASARTASTSSGRRRARTRPVTYTWSPAGALVLRAHVPDSPSPVLYVPAAIRDLLEGRDLPLRLQHDAPGPDTVPGAAQPAPFPPATTDRPEATLRVKGGNAWGFAPLLAAADLRSGDAFDLHCDLVAGIATLMPVPPQGETT